MERRQSGKHPSSLEELESIPIVFDTAAPVMAHASDSEDEALNDDDQDDDEPPQDGAGDV